MNSPNSQTRLIFKDEAVGNSKNGMKIKIEKTYHAKQPYLNLQQISENKQDSNRYTDYERKKLQMSNNADSSTQNTQFYSPKNVLTGRKSSNYLMNYFNNQKSDHVLTTQNERSSTDLYSINQMNYDQLYSPKSIVSGLATPSKGIYVQLNNLIPPKFKKQTFDTQGADLTMRSNPKEKPSISQRLNNLKKFYNAEGPSVDKSIVPKTSYQQYRGSVPLTSQLAKKQFNYSHDNLDSQPDIRIVISKDKNKRDIQSPPSTALPSTPYQFQYKSVGHSKKPSIIQVNELNQENQQPQFGSKTVLYGKSNDTVNQNIKNDVYDMTTQQGQQNKVQNPSRTSLSLNVPMINPITQQLENGNQQQHKKSIILEGDNKSRSPSAFYTKQSLFDPSGRSDSNKRDKRQVPFKNVFQRGTENYFKIEIQNLQENSSKKFILCAEYEAHRNYKSDPNQAEKYFIQSLDGMLPLVKEMTKYLNTASTQSKDVNSTDNYFTEINNLAQTSKNGYLQVLSLFFHAKVSFEYRDYVKTINLAKKCKNLAQIYGYIFEKMKSYELIGQAYNAIQKHKLSIIYQIKLSWLLLNENQELKAYDQLGKCYYYLGDLEKAYYYHEKMMTGEVEKDQSIKQLSNSKLLNREYRSNIDVYRKKKNQEKKQYEYGEEVPEEDEYISSSDDEFEITVSIKVKNDNNLQSCRVFDQDENYNKYLPKSKSSTALGWNDKLIMARLKVLQIQRTKEMKSFTKNVSITAADLQQDQIGKVECLMDMKSKEYLQKIFKQRGKATNMQKKYRISHLTPNRTILSYHEAESHFLKNKNYTSQQDFIPTIDTQNLKKIHQIILKYKSLLSETAVQISNTLVNSPIFQMISSNSLKTKPEQYNQKGSNFQDQSDFKFKKMQEKDAKYNY